MKPKEEEFAKSILVKSEIWTKVEEYCKLVKISTSNFEFSFNIFLKRIKIESLRSIIGGEDAKEREEEA